MSVTYWMWVLIVAFWCWGFYHAFKKDEVLGGPGKIMLKTFPDSLAKPTFACPICMASIHGTTWYLIAMIRFEQVPKDFFLWVLFVVAVSGINYCISKVQYED